MSEQSEKNKRFEKAKAEWLKKLGNKSIAEYSAELERESDKRMAEYSNDPEMKKMWADAEKG